ncbi:MAG TPA: carboxypeptidase-like regulatory domain-containing protein [Vicinamibacterales bacterium]|nr:carboxypeptidase-like regulatory domain-containing protein [Vicinamibacterales bacterium]
MKVRTIVFSLGVQLLLASVVSAQSTVANVVGTVQDQSSLPLPGVMVVLRSVDENTSQDVVSDNAGTFQFLNVKPGTYARTGQIAFRVTF